MPTGGTLGTAEYPSPMRITQQLNIRLYPENADSQSEDTTVLTMNNWLGGLHFATN